MNHDTAKETQVAPYLNGYPLVCWSNRQQVPQSWLSASREEIQTSDLQISAATPPAEAKRPVHRMFAQTPRSSSRMSGYSGSQNPSKEMLTGVEFTGWTSYDCTADENKIELLSLLSKSFLILCCYEHCDVAACTSLQWARPTSYQRCYADRWPPAQPSPAQPSPAQLALFFLYVWDARQSKAHPVLSIEALPQTWTCIPWTKTGTWQMDLALHFVQSLILNVSEAVFRQTKTEAFLASTINGNYKLLLAKKTTTI